ncbi:hypothetical protein CPC08DRAFT_621265, partial [Agrocybe pediades]
EELLIDFKEVVGEHSGANVAAAVWATLEHFGLVSKMQVFVMDNTSNNDTMLKSIEERCHKAGIPFLAASAHGRCMPHTIQLA